MKAEKAEQEKKPELKVWAKAFRALAWRCPECGLTQLAERSSHHVGECRRCVAIVDVRVAQES